MIAAWTIATAPAGCGRIYVQIIKENFIFLI
jgi:hypothetical protein